MNLHRRREDKVLQPADVMPWLNGEESPEPGKQSPEEMRRLMEEVTLAMGGIVHPRNVPLAGG